MAHRDPPAVVADAAGAGLRFRAPGAALPLLDLLERALPELSGPERVALVRTGEVTVDREVRLAGDALVAAGASVALPAGERMPRPTAGLLPASGDSSATPGLCVLTLDPPWQRGTLACGGARTASLRFERVERRGVTAELRVRLEAPGATLAEVLVALADAGMAVIGDIWHGGVLASGGLRAVSDDRALPDLWWPREALLAGRSPRAGGAAESFAISRSSAGILARGHPWVLADAQSGDPLRYRPGALVKLESSDGEDAGLALADGEGACVARRWSPPGQRPASIEQRVRAACDRRAALHTDEQTDAYRLVHGESDGLPGLAIDRLGSVLRVLVQGRCALALREAALESARREIAERSGVETTAVEVVHLRRPRGARVECTRVVAGDPAALCLDERGRLSVRERGLRFYVELGLADPERSAPGVGLFLDQRENRERVARLVRAAPGGRCLNLFAHTGAFSAALLEAGAREVVSVDLSARYLQRLEANLELNRDLGVAPGHHLAVRRDGRRFLEELGPRDCFRGIVLDPPTAAAAGRRFWSIRKDLQPLIEKSLEHLEPAGWLLVARNDRGVRGASLGEAVEAAASRVGVALRSVEPAPAGRDFPRLEGFPEGEPFRAVLVRLEP